MKNLTELRQKRLQSLIKEMGKYGRLIFNDHFSVILFVILGFFMFFYREQLVVLQGDHTTVLKTPLIL
ncbi:MAG TPA: ABC transporter permease, partial [Globicatella sulfidifaciens]|nr:ABC transporter permease [Globicatella sulfidifaciens]